MENTTNEEIKTEEIVKNIPVCVAADLMDKTQQFVRIGLQRNILPFGHAICITTRYTYYISPSQFCEYTGISMTTVVEEVMKAIKSGRVKDIKKGKPHN